MVLVSAVGTALDNELDGKEPIAGGEGLASRIGDDFPRQLPRVPSRDGSGRVPVLRQFPVKSSFGLIFTLNRFQSYKTRFLTAFFPFSDTVYSPISYT